MQKDINFSDIILTHKKSIVASRSECDITTKIGNKKYTAPVCCSNMKSLLTPNICEMFDKNGWFYVYHRLGGPDDVETFVHQANLRGWHSVSISVGIGQEWNNLIERLGESGARVDCFTVDVALSYNEIVVPTINMIKKIFPNTYLIVGNGSTAEWVNWLEDLGVNCAKVGIGVSSACRTRQYTGFGSTTVSSLIRCVESAKYIEVMSDGGLTVDSRGEVWIGDINKAFVLGADYVMTGAAFSRCVDSPTALDGYYGNASEYAKKSATHVEGARFAVSQSGLTISQTCDLIADSIKSGISYAGGNTLEAFRSVSWALCN